MSNDASIGLISGTGEEGRGIALRLAASGIPVKLGSRTEEKALSEAGAMNKRLGEARVEGMDNGRLFEACRILFLTVPFIHAEGVLEKHREQFTGDHILVDVTVPVIFDQGPRLLQLEEGSGAEYIRRRLPAQTPLVAAFKTLPAHLLGELDATVDCDEFLCSDSVEARKEVRRLVEKIQTLRWIEAGPLKYCRALEAMTFLAISLNRRFKVHYSRFRVVGLDS